MSYWLKFAILAAITALSDVVWAQYNIACAERQATRAAILGALIYAIGGTIILSYTTERDLLPACVLGAFAGTYIGVRVTK